MKLIILLAQWWAGMNQTRFTQELEGFLEILQIKYRFAECAEHAWISFYLSMLYAKCPHSKLKCTHRSNTHGGNDTTIVLLQKKQPSPMITETLMSKATVLAQQHQQQRALSHSQSSVGQGMQNGVNEVAPASTADAANTNEVTCNEPKSQHKMKPI